MRHQAAAAVVLPSSDAWGGALGRGGLMAGGYPATRDCRATVLPSSDAWGRGGGGGSARCLVGVRRRRAAGRLCSCLPHRPVVLVPAPDAPVASNSRSPAPPLHLCSPQGDYAVGQVFLPTDPIQYEQAKKVIHQVASNQGHEVLGWRRVPTDNRYA